MAGYYGIYIGIPSSSNNKKFTVLSELNGNVIWQMDSTFDGEVVGLKLGG
jgi:hypothetical protein